ncbi:hypothetical protein GS532_23740 [Rhodococcus hoagii]|nr:hypothetical protein [Prescottella equi]
MAVEFVGVSTFTTTSTLLSITSRPTGTAAGDLLVMALVTWAQPLSYVPEGWTVAVSDGTTTQAAMLFRIADMTAKDQPYVQLGGTGNHAAAVHAFRGVDPAEPVGSAVYSYDSSSLRNKQTPAITTSGEDGMLLRLAASGVNTANHSWTWAAAATEVTDFRTSSGYRFISTAIQPAPIPDTYGTVQATFTFGSYAYMITAEIRAKRKSRLHLGNTPLPLMLGNTELEFMGP